MALLKRIFFQGSLAAQLSLPLQVQYFMASSSEGEEDNYVPVDSDGDSDKDMF